MTETPAAFLKRMGARIWTIGDMATCCGITTEDARAAMARLHGAVRCNSGGIYQAAWAAPPRPASNELKNPIMSVVIRAEAPMSAGEIADAIGRDAKLIRTRLSQLCDAGLMTLAGTKIGASGRRVAVYTAAGAQE
jgi:hypothetical protein